MYYEARERALNNDHVFHLAAILWRGKTPVYVGINSFKTHPKFARTCRDGHQVFFLHAEMSALRFARPGDMIEVMRWRKSNHDEFAMAKPCDECMKHIVARGISRVRYTNTNGDWVEMKL